MKKEIPYKHESGVVMLILDKTDFRAKKIASDREGQLVCM